MQTEEIKNILSPLIKPELLEQARAEGILDDTIFTQTLFIAMTSLNPKLLIKSLWQLSALCSGLVNFKAPIDWNQTDNMGALPAHYVAWSGNVEQLQWVLTQDKEALTRTDNRGLTAVHFAAWSGNPAILDWMLIQDTDALTRKDKFSRTAVHYAALSGNPAILEWVLERDKDALTRIDNDGRTAVHYAAASGNPAILQ